MTKSDRQDVMNSDPIRILCVEDEAHDRELIRHAFEKEAEGFVIKTPHHIAQLPRTVQRVLKAKTARGQLLEMHSNFRSLVADTADGILTEGHAFLKKPFKTEELVRKVREILDK